MNPSQQLHLEIIWILLSGGKMEKKSNQTTPHVVKSSRRGEGEKETNQTKLHIVKIWEGPAGREWKEIMKPNQQLRLETVWLLLSIGKWRRKPNQTKLHVVWSWGLWVKKTKPNQVAHGVELGSLGKENQTKSSCTWRGVGAPG